MSDTSIIKATYNAASTALQNAKTAYNSANSKYLELLAEDASGDSTGKYASLNQAGKSQVGSYIILFLEHTLNDIFNLLSNFIADLFSIC